MITIILMAILAIIAIALILAVATGGVVIWALFGDVLILVIVVVLLTRLGKKKNK